MSKRLKEILYIDPGSVSKEDAPSSPPSNRETVSTSTATSFAPEGAAAGVGASSSLTGAETTTPPHLPPSPSTCQEIVRPATTFLHKEKQQVLSEASPEQMLACLQVHQQMRMLP